MKSRSDILKFKPKVTTLGEKGTDFSSMRDLSWNSP